MLFGGFVLLLASFTVVVNRVADERLHSCSFSITTLVSCLRSLLNGSLSAKARSGPIGSQELLAHMSTLGFVSLSYSSDTVQNVFEMRTVTTTLVE